MDAPGLVWEVRRDERCRSRSLRTSLLPPIPSGIQWASPCPFLPRLLPAACAAAQDPPGQQGAEAAKSLVYEREKEKKKVKNKLHLPA